jgi:hypothetical protein
VPNEAPQFNITLGDLTRLTHELPALVFEPRPGDLAAHVFDGGREPHGPDQVVHEDEVAGLGAVAVYLQHFSLHSPLDKARDDAVLVA